MRPRGRVRDHSSLQYLNAVPDLIGEFECALPDLSTEASVLSHHVAEENFTCCRCFGSGNFVHQP
jgi:hypothetical protein